MPKVSRPEAKEDGMNLSAGGFYGDYYKFSDEGGYIGFEHYEADLDCSPFFQACPGKQCQCPHWGYVTSGKIDFVFEDRTETYNAGDAFYVPVGHVAKVYKGGAIVIFSPSKEWEGLIDASAPIIRAAAEAQGNA